MDPGNWATDLQAGASFGYTLLIVVLLSSLTAMFLQFLSLKLGIATGRDLAQACRDSYHPKVLLMLQKNISQMLSIALATLGNQCMAAIP